MHRCSKKVWIGTIENYTDFLDTAEVKYMFVDEANSFNDDNCSLNIQRQLDSNNSVITLTVHPNGEISQQFVNFLPNTYGLSTKTSVCPFGNNSKLYFLLHYFPEKDISFVYLLDIDNALCIPRGMCSSDTCTDVANVIY